MVRRFNRDASSVILVDVPEYKFRKVEPDWRLRRDRDRVASFAGTCFTRSRELRIMSYPRDSVTSLANADTPLSVLADRQSPVWLCPK